MALPIGFFMPLPLAMMIPFMGVQSAVMAKQFGENFQYGKRRISAMSNEEFNRLTPKILMENANVELKAMIPAMEASVTEMRTFQTFLIREFIAMIKEAIGAGIGELVGGIGSETDKDYWEHFFHGHRGSKAHAPATNIPSPQPDFKSSTEIPVPTPGVDSTLFGKETIVHEETVAHKKHIAASKAIEKAEWTPIQELHFKLYRFAVESKNKWRASNETITSFIHSDGRRYSARVLDDLMLRNRDWIVKNGTFTPYFAWLKTFT